MGVSVHARIDICSHPVAVVRGATLNMCAHVFVCGPVFHSFGNVSGSGITGPYGGFIFNFEGLPNCLL